jgi:hypothetical protein
MQLQLKNNIYSISLINYQMSDSLLLNAAMSGDLENVKELLSNGTGTGYRDKVS